MEIKAFLAGVGNQVNPAYAGPIIRWAKNVGTINLRVLNFSSNLCGSLANITLSLRQSERSDWLLILSSPDEIKFSIVSGALVAGSQLSFIWSLEFASAMVAGIVTILAPAIIDLFDSVIIRKKPPTLKLVGHCLLLGGALCRRIMYKDPFRVRPTSSKWEIVLGFILSFLGNQQVLAWALGKIQEKMKPNCGDSFAMKSMIGLVGTTLEAPLYLAYPNHGSGNGNTTSNVVRKTLLYLSLPFGAAMQAGATWCVQLKGTKYLASFSYLSPLINTIAAPILLGSPLEPIGMIVICIFITIGAIMNVQTMEAEAASQEANISSGNHQGEGIDLSEDLESQLQAQLTTGATSNHHLPRVHPEPSNTGAEPAAETVATYDQGDGEEAAGGTE